MRIAAKVAVLAAAIVAACASLVAGEARAEDPSPCSLIEAAEVEAITGPLAGPPYRASGPFPDVNGDTCRYETPDLRSIGVRVEWRDGGETFAIINMTQGAISEGGLKGKLKLSDGTELVGEWDEARVFMCCEFNALRGEQLVVIDVGAAQATIEQAAALADAALLRIDEPLAVDDAAAIAAAEARDAARPQQRPVCDLVPRAAAEAIIGAPLAGDPVGDDSRCTYTFTAPSVGFEQEMELNVTWRGGFSEMRLIQSAMGQAFSMLQSEGLPIDDEAKRESAALDELSVNMIGVTAVKKDVMLSIETGGMGNDIAQALIEKAAAGL